MARDVKKSTTVVLMSLLIFLKMFPTGSTKYSRMKLGTSFDHSRWLSVNGGKIYIIIFYSRFGYIIGKYPWTTILVTMIIFIAMSCGLLKFQRSTDDEFLWTPYGSDVRIYILSIGKIKLM